MELKWLNTFVTAAETGNFRTSAEKLFISQPSITVHIKQLEESLSIQLFERNHTQIQLTKEGKHFYKLAKEILQKVDESKREIKLFAAKSKVHLTIALSPLLVETNLPNLIYRCMIDCPQYEIEIIIEDSNNMEELLLTNKVQLAICLEKSHHSLIHSEKIGSSTFQFIYPTSHNLNGIGTYSQIKDLIEKYPLLTGHLEAVTPIDKMLAMEFPNLRKMMIKQSYIIKRFVKDGLGIAFLPKFVVQKDLKVKELNSLHFDLFLLPTMDVYMQYNKKDEIIQFLLKIIRDSFITLK